MQFNSSIGKIKLEKNNKSNNNLEMEKTVPVET